MTIAPLELVCESGKASRGIRERLSEKNKYEDYNFGLWFEPEMISEECLICSEGSSD